MGSRLVSLGLIGLLVALHAQLWLGRGSIPSVTAMQAELVAQKKHNDLAQAANDRLGAEVSDLKEGLEMVEEKARLELGMVKANEIYVQISSK
jgi:cell division protein FtsB